MRWFVEISSLGQNAPPTRKVCVEAPQWQPALQKARALRGDGGPLNNFSVDLLESGYRAIDPATRVRYLVQRAPDDAALTDGADAPAGVSPAGAASPAPADPAARVPGKRPAAATVPFISMGAALLVPEPAGAAAKGGGAAPERGAAPEPSALPPFELVSEREENPSERSPLTYRELVYAVPTGTPRDLVGALLLDRLEKARQLIDDARPGKFIHIAVFDHVFRGRPQRGPLATLAWKDWRSAEPEIQFRPRTGATTPPPALAPPADGSPAAGGSPPAAGPPVDVSPSADGPPAPAAPVTDASRSAAAPVADASPSAAAPPADGSPAVAAPVADASSSAAAPAADASRSAAAPVADASPSAATPAADASPPAATPAADASPPAATPAADASPPAATPAADVSPPAATPAADASPPAAAPSEEQSGPPRPESAPESAEIPVPAPSQPQRRRSSFPPRNGRLSGDDLIAELFEACSDLHFLQDTLAGADFILALTLDKIPCALGLVSLFDINRREFVVVRQYGGKSALLARLPERAPLALAAMRSRRAVVVPDASRDERVIDDRWKAIGVELRSVICAPVELGGRYLGLLEIGNPLDGKPFSESDGNALTYIGQQFAEFVGSRGVVLDPGFVTAGAKKAAR
ncbi:GAF domain-containing protein [Sorangium sp. So ce1078]|uniref:GAF domain-containing protein n=1 Tax=Sorangium sp. So ce1078 TaxID=3133329 RepID=UPI003F6486DF